MNDLTRGPVTRHLLALSAFMTVSMLFQTLYYLADLYFVGRLGKEAFAPVPVAEAVPDRIGVEDADGTGAIG